MKIKLLLFLISFSCYGQIAVPTFQPQIFGGRATHGSINTARPNQFNSQRIMPYGGGNTQQNQGQTQPSQNQNQAQSQQKQPLRSYNNRYSVNRSNIMGFGSYNRLNLRDHKAQILAAQKYKEKLSSMRINLRAYRIQPVQPVTPTQPQPQPQPQPSNGGGQIGIGGGAGPNPPQFPTGPQPRPAVLPTQPSGPVAVGMPAPQPR